MKYNMTFIEDLIWRGLVKDCTDLEGLKERLNKPVIAYCGIDPTADSLHIGHLQQIILLKRYQQAGHTPIAICGGGTGMIGDPRPTTERKLISQDELLHNINCIKIQLSQFLDFDNNVILLNNYDWLSKISLIDFLRDYGKYFNISNMIAKDTIASRLSTGISFTEFTYTILQAIDWLYLYENYNCEVQIGGSDQWGNLVSGSDLIKKIKGDTAKVYGITSPLITKSDGSKFGKSEGGNIWLDPKKTSPYEFYQFWLNVADEDSIEYLKKLTLIDREEIEELQESLAKEAHLRKPQKRLAQYLTELVSNKEGLDSAINITNTLFSGDITSLSLEDLKVGLKDASSSVINDGDNIIDVLVKAKVCNSNREARELISNNSIAINGTKINDLSFNLYIKDALYNELSIVKKGKKNWYICYFERTDI